MQEGTPLDFFFNFFSILFRNCHKVRALTSYNKYSIMDVTNIFKRKVCEILIFILNNATTTVQLLTNNWRKYYIEYAQVRVVYDAGIGARELSL